jgi:hypothetical protein
MDRKIELDQLSDEMFNEILNTVNAEVLEITKKAQDKVNKLLHRFGVRCSLSLSYQVLSEEEAKEIPSKKRKRSRN